MPSPRLRKLIRSKVRSRVMAYRQQQQLSQEEEEGGGSSSVNGDLWRYSSDVDEDDNSSQGSVATKQEPHMSWESWMVVMSTAASRSPLTFVATNKALKRMGRRLFEKEDAFDDKASEGSAKSTPSSEGEERQEEEEDLCCLFSLTSSVDEDEGAVDDAESEAPRPPPPPGRKSSLRSISSYSSLTSSSSWGSSSDLGGVLQRKRSVDFSCTDHVVLIPARADYHDDIKKEIWWAREDYDGFQQTALELLRRFGSDWLEQSCDEEERQWLGDLHLEARAAAAVAAAIST